MPWRVVIRCIVVGIAMVSGLVEWVRLYCLLLHGAWRCDGVCGVVMCHAVVWRVMAPGEEVWFPLTVW